MREFIHRDDDCAMISVLPLNFFDRNQPCIAKFIHENETRREKSKSGNDCTNRFPKLESLNMKNRPDFVSFRKGEFMVY